MTSALNTTGCVASAIPFPTVFGAEILSLNASVVTNYDYQVQQGRYASSHAFNATGLNFCNVSIYYTHPGYNDLANTQVLLPLDNWNGRFQGTGGGGFVVGLSEPAMVGAVAQGYAVASSDGGHKTTVTEEWVLSSPGNINWANVLGFGSQSLYDFTVIGKAVTESFYGRSPEYSYFTGCSTGGRQALMLAQRWPELYDGILAGAPGINYAELVSWLQYPQLLMHWSQEYPQPCETDAITAAAIKACDELDGVADGIISNPEACHFDPFTLVNTTIRCKESGKDTMISHTAALVASGAWKGSRSTNGTFLWYGLNKDAPLNSGLAGTTCDYSQGTANCSAAPFAIAKEWPQYFIYKDPDFVFEEMTHVEYQNMVHRSIQEYTSSLGTNDPDIRLFGESGGKILMWQGLGDQLVPINGTRQYYETASRIDVNTTDYFRYFEAPGVHHCRQGPGPYPGDIFQALVEWVEKDSVPETLVAKSLPDDSGITYERELCLYPLVQSFKGGDMTKAGSFECISSK